MSLTGNAAAEKLLRGKINRANVIYTDTYGLAVRNGYKGTIDEWLKAIANGGISSIEQTTISTQDGGKNVITVTLADGTKSSFVVRNGSGESIPTAKLATIKLLASAWVGADSLYSQVVAVEDVTPYSKVDLLPSVEQLAIFHNKDVTFVTENEDGVVTVYAIGDKPTQDYIMQAEITEVEV